MFWSGPCLDVKTGSLSYDKFEASVFLWDVSGHNILDVLPRVL